MKIGLISDTHLPALGLVPPSEVALAFAGVDLILHAGDIYSAACLDWLELIAPVIAVEVAPAPVVGDPRVIDGALGRILTLEGHTIGLVHDLMVRGVDEVRPGALGAKFPADRSLSDAVAQFFGSRVDTVVFGHTHYAMAETHQDILFVNPGSPTLPKQVRKLGTVAVMELGPATERSARIVDLAEFTRE